MHFYFSNGRNEHRGIIRTKTQLKIVCVILTITSFFYLGYLFSRDNQIRKASLGNMMNLVFISPVFDTTILSHLFYLYFLYWIARASTYSISNCDGKLKKSLNSSFATEPIIHPPIPFSFAPNNMLCIAIPASTPKLSVIFLSPKITI